MGKEWEQVKRTLDEIDDDEGKLECVLFDIWVANDIKADERINLFIGKVYDINGQLYVTDIETVFGDPCSKNPYNDSNTLRAFIAPPVRMKLQEDDRVIFKAHLGRLLWDHELILVADRKNGHDVKTFSELDLSETADYSEVMDHILNTNKVPSFKKVLFECNINRSVTLLGNKKKELETEIYELGKQKEDILKAVSAAQEGTEKYKELLEETRQKKRETEAEIVNIGYEIKDYRKRYHDLFSEAAENESNKIARKIDGDCLKLIKERLMYNYDDSRIKAFLMALTTSQIIALCGDPGTGKTTFAKQMSDALGAVFHLIQVQNNWTDRSDILGFYNPINEIYQSTEFLDALIEARDDLDRRGAEAPLHIICLDEMNLARVEYYFATMLSLMQQAPEDRIINVLPWDVRRKLKDDPENEAYQSLIRYRNLCIPDNVRFVGTMNMDDTAQHLSPKVIDRCLFIEFGRDQISGVNTDHNNSSDIYFPADEFREISDMEIADDAPEITGVLKRVSPRLDKYRRCMWPMYSRLCATQDEETDDAVADHYVDLFLCTKVLPSLTSLEEAAGILSSAKYQKTVQRLEAGKERGRLIHPFDEDSWSFWE